MIFQSHLLDYKQKQTEFAVEHFFPSKFLDDGVDFLRVGGGTEVETTECWE